MCPIAMPAFQMKNEEKIKSVILKETWTNLNL